MTDQEKIPNHIQSDANKRRHTGKPFAENQGINACFGGELKSQYRT